MVHADPMVVPMNPSSRDLVELLQLVTAYLAYFPVWDLDLGIVTKNYYHQSSTGIEPSNFRHSYTFIKGRLFFRIDKFIMHFTLIDHLDISIAEVYLIEYNRFCRS
jgi:hypothetical protein